MAALPGAVGAAPAAAAAGASAGSAATAVPSSPVHTYLPSHKDPPGMFSRISFETGTSYLGGLLIGGSYGLFSGGRDCFKHNYTGKLAINQVRTRTGSSSYHRHRWQRRTEWRRRRGFCG